MQSALEPTRIREHGTRITRTNGNPALRIQALRDVLVHGYAKIDGYAVDSFTASAIIAVYDALNDANKAKYASMKTLRGMASVAWKFVK